MARSAGTYAQLTSREGKYAILKFLQAKFVWYLHTCRATVGTVGNSEHVLEKSGKAGRSTVVGKKATHPWCSNEPG
jgi:large subunit ribosomal protein L2